MNRRIFRSFYVAAALAGFTSILPVTSAHAATAETTISVNFPSIVVLYTYDSITLDVSEAGLGAAIKGGATTVSCSSDQCTASQAAVKDLTATQLTLDGNDVITADITSAVGALPTDIEVTINDAFGARCLGCGTGDYTVTTVDGGDSDVIGNFSPSAMPQNGLTLSTGSLSFQVDLSQVTSNGVVTEDVTITVTSNL